MARLIGVLVILVLIVAAIGFYRGWFAAQGSNGPNHADVNVTVDKNAIRQDTEAAKDKAEQAGAQLKESVSAATRPTTQPAANP